MPEAQGALFPIAPREIAPSPPTAEHLAVAARLPAAIRLGTTSWSYPGWEGCVYGARVSAKDLAHDGLTAYAKHPLLRAVEIDRTYYEPMTAEDLARFARQVPEGFRFFAKAHEDCVTARFPLHARYGKKRGEANARYLDPAFAADAVVAPFAEGLGAKAGVLLFQFPPHEVTEPRAFAEDLHAFLVRLPKGVTYAVELRNRELLVPAYADAIADAGVVHCHNVWGAMPAVDAQARRLPPAARRPFVVRWLLRPGDSFEAARARYAPFDRLVDPDLATRALVAKLVTRAHAHGVDAYVVLDNKAEGSAPRSAFALAASIVDASAP
jgi:uncharacterized protein YecE (DUF72 family)